MEQIHSQLRAADEKVRALRAERNRARRVWEAARGAAAEAETDATLDAAGAAKQALSDVDGLLEQAQDEQVSLLGRVADMESGRAGGFSYSHSTGGGWGEVARRIDLAAGVTTVDVAGMSLLQAQIPSGGSVGLRPPPSAATTTTAAQPTSGLTGPYFAYQVFGRQDTGGEAAVTDFTVSFSQPEVTGTERALAVTTTKKTLPATYGLATPPVKQHAIIADSIPNKLFDSAAFGPFVDTELRRQVDLSVDRHVIAQISASSPPSGSSGTGLIAKLRNAVAASRATGAWPTTVLLSPADASSLDLSTTGGDAVFVFALRDTGTASPLWALQVVESSAVTSPVLVDPKRAGVLYTGRGTVTVDNLSGLSTNVSRIRVELEALLHVRNAQSIYVIA